jgi:uncharacterized protein
MKLCPIALFLCLALLRPASAAPVDLSRLAGAAAAQAAYTTGYDGSYRVIAYPGGDVPRETGVCTDVIIRAYRTLGIDLQKLVHEDMRRHFSLYPRHWGLKRPDANIDHRRVPNLQTFFTRFGESLGPSDNPGDYRPGDLVIWDLSYPRRPLPHIGVVTERKSAAGGRPLIAHNIGAGVKVEDILFAYKITGHYRYRGPD